MILSHICHIKGSHDVHLGVPANATRTVCTLAGCLASHDCHYEELNSKYIHPC